jgi:hypothetical protein
MNKIGRNDPCPCGSGKKYKKCCFTFLGAQLKAISGDSLMHGDLIPYDIPRVKLYGKVLSNDGTKAEVDPQDGRDVIVAFYRDHETPEEFAKQFVVGDLFELERLSLQE